MTNILVAEDNRDLAELLEITLRKNGFSVLRAANGEQALQTIERIPVDLLVTDVMMPVMDGITLTKRLREERYNLPILMVTVKDDYQTMQEGFGTGVDDYMIKPVNISELILRVKALLRRARINAEQRIVVGSTVVDMESQTVREGNKETELPLKEFQLLFKLLSYPNVIFTREQIMDDIWGTESESDERTLNTHVHRLRDKFVDNPDFEIVTIRGLGYKAVKKHE